MNNPAQIRPGQMYRAEKPVRDPAYRRFIKTLPCAACLKCSRVDPCHTGPHGIGQKSSDLSCIPLCRRCHQQFDSDPYGFAGKHHLEIPALIARLNEFYREKITRRVA